VADANNHRIQKFDMDGNFLTKWGSYGSGNRQFNSPYGVAVDSVGNVYVSDTYNDRIQKFDAGGNFLSKWGSPGLDDGQFYSPHGVAVDSVGNVYVSDTYSDRIQKFDSGGYFSTKWGSPGGGDGQFNSPYGVAVDSADIVYVVDTNNHRIQKFGEERLDDPCTVVYLDIRPWSSKNPLNVKSRGVLAVAIIGTELLDVRDIDPPTIRLARDETEGRDATVEGYVAPIRWGYVDISTPLEEEHFSCIELDPDGYEDFIMLFRTQSVVRAIGEVSDGEKVVLSITGYFADGAEFEGEDFVTILKKDKGKEKKEKERRRRRRRKNKK